MGPDQSDAAKILYIHGHPSFGKIILTAKMTEKLGREKLVVYFIFFFQQPIEKATTTNLRSWVAQLVASSDAACKIAKEVYATKKFLRLRDRNYGSFWIAQREGSLPSFCGRRLDEYSTISFFALLVSHGLFVCRNADLPLLR